VTAAAGRGPDARGGRGATIAHDASAHVTASHVGRIAVCVLTLSLTFTTGAAAQNANEAWAALVDGSHVALIRHANAPPGYGGDPPGMRIDDCKTQRNLDDLGRQEAREIGDVFRQRGVRVDRTLSSPMCRCLDTARLMAVGTVETSWALLPRRTADVAVRRSQLKEIVATWRGPGTLVLITHGETVRNVLGFLPRQAEITVLRPSADDPAGGELVGRILPYQP
jgi:phosphohistidine phosphatase SixA